MKELMLFCFLIAILMAASKKKTISRRRKGHAMKLAICALLSALFLDPSFGAGSLKQPVVMILALCMAWQMLCIALLPGEPVEKDK